MEISGLQRGEPAGAEHWRLLDTLKTTVEGLVSGNSRNVWSKYGGLQRLCRDMSSILQHGLVCDQVYSERQEYWNFVKSSQQLQSEMSSEVGQFLLSNQNRQRNGDSTSDGDSGQLWLQHGLQFHCLSAQLKALLGNAQYTKRFYTDSAFLLSRVHVAAMFQCLEAVEQNDPRLLAQIDTSVLAGKREHSLSVKSLSLTALPGSTRFSHTDYPQHSHYGSYSSLQLPTGAPGTDFHPSSMVQQNQNKICDPLAEDEPPVVSIPPFCDTSSRKAFSPVSDMSISTLTSHSDEAGIQEDPASEADDGPEYLAIGNMCRRTSTQSSGSSGSNLFSSCSSLKPESLGRCTPAPPGSSLLRVARRSSFSEGQTGSGQSSARKSHTRSHSDTNVATGKPQGGDRTITMILEDPTAESRADLSMRNNPALNCKANSSSAPYMEHDGPQYLSATDGVFRRPSKGQSLISYLSEQDFGSCADLEKENAHFSISESLIAAIELMKCNVMCRQLQEEEDDSDREICELKRKIRLRRQQIQIRQTLSNYGDRESSSQGVTDSGSQISSHESTRMSDSGSADEVDQDDVKDADIKRSSSGRSAPGSESISHYFLHSNSAEAVAMGLLKQFEGMQLPAASELEWLVPEDDAPQKLLPIPDSVPISPDDGEHADIYKLRIRVRGNLEWAPPRPQIIFNIHPAPTRKVAVTKQNYRCAGCGIRTEPDYIKRLRYCDYLGKYFCQCCHENAQSVIPSRILRKWDFSKNYISNFSKDLLTKIWSDPLFNVQDVNGSLYRKVKALEQVRLLRVQLVHLKNMFKTCRLAKGVLESYDTVPGHLTDDLHLLSLSDLIAIKKGELAPGLKELVKVGTLHVDKCMLCQAKGFICEFCQNEEDVIFPFELYKCRRCEECKACYHRCCFRSDQCPKCDRLRARRDLLARQSLESYNSDQEEETPPERDTD